MVGLLGQTYSVGDTIKDFTLPICSNGDSDSLSFYAYSGAENGGSHHVIWINFFTSW
ncbi:MAG: hypothetical protein VX822_02745 [Candidatus Neomarinimicrobiota bacterium]|nr:hypothetical protein [Candidatus Neomarinimicrobiota bacterium]